VTGTEMAALAAMAMAAATITPEKRLTMTISFGLATRIVMSGKRSTCQSIRNATDGRLARLGL
jgi:TRAP-type mannitol/chloroaromatic compound transport system substrate-binding protein